MQSLFPSRTQSTRSNATALLSFNAGKCNLIGPNASGKYQVTADPRKGTITLERGFDGLVTLKWIDRQNGRAEDNRVIFPFEMTFKKAKTGREGDRVYVASFPANRQHFLYWMQDKSNEKDEENCRKLGELVNNPSAAGETGDGMNGDWMQMMGLAPRGTPAFAPNRPAQLGLESLDLSSLLNQFANPSTSSAAPPTVSFTEPAPAAPAANPSSSSSTNSIPSGESTVQASAGSVNTPAPAVTIEDLQRAMGLYPGAPATGHRRRPLSLENVLTADAITASGVLDDPAVRQALIAHLPQGQQSDEGLFQNIHSPQFQQSLRSFSNALHTDGYSAIMSNLGIDGTPGTMHMLQGDNVRAMLVSLEAAVPQSSSSSSAGAGSTEQAHDDSVPMTEDNSEKDKFT